MAVGLDSPLERLGPSVWLMRLAGEHDLATLPHVQAAFDEAARADNTIVVVDLDEVTFIDSSVMGAIVKAHRGGETVLVVEPKAAIVRKALDLVNLSDVVAMFADRDAALNRAREIGEQADGVHADAALGR